MDAEDLTAADRAILDELAESALTKKAIVDSTGLHRNTVGNRLDVLAAGNLINCIHETTALYRLVSDPRMKNTEEAAYINKSEFESNIRKIIHGLDEIEKALSQNDLKRARDILDDVRETIQDNK
jgi:DNA-binding Lrp family transcriptional regulator